MNTKIKEWLYNNRGWTIVTSCALLTIVLFNLLSYQNSFVERYYSNGLFVGIRHLWDYTIGWSPIPLLYVLIFTLLLVISQFVTNILKNSFDTIQFIFRLVKGIVFLLSIAVISFYWLWGFNYKRPALTTLIQLERQQPNQDQLFEELESVTNELVVLRSAIGDMSMIHLMTAIDENELRATIEKTFDQLDIIAAGRVRLRKLYPKGSLLRTSTAGVYLPFVGEGHIDPGLHPITWPFTMMHEMSHGYGQTGEDASNFLSLLACANSENILIRYSGYFAYWRYLRSNAYRADQDRFGTFWSGIDATLLSDLKEVVAYSDRYPDILPKLRDLFYDNYLKSHGVSDGLRSYSQIIVLAYSWQQKNGSLKFQE